MKDINRRDFLKKGSLATVATVVGAVGLSASNKKTTKEKFIPKEQIIPEQAQGKNRGTEMKIIQFSDTHLRGDDLLSFGKYDTVAMTKKAMDFFINMPEKDMPDFFVCTGDIADHGNIPAYKKCKEYFSKLPRPVYCIPGNHDVRKDMIETLGKEFCPIEKGMEPYFCYSIDDKPVRVICVDTLIEGKHWGGMTDKILTWLDKKLAEQPNKPTLVFAHHPPFEMGMGWMDEGFENLDPFLAILRKYKDNVRLCCAHVHRSTTTKLKDVDMITTDSICLQMELDLRPQGGNRFFLGDPGYTVHHLYHGRINTHFCKMPMQATNEGPYPFEYLESDLKK